MKLYKNHPKMILGDDYTRLKDALEPILLSVIVFLGFFIWVDRRISFLFFSLAVIYTILQFAIAVKICLKDKTFKYLYLAYITFLRGTARTIGMWKGILSFLWK